MKKRILITGGEGVLAQYAKISLKDFVVFSPNSRELNITDKNLVNRFFDKTKPDIVIHLAAKTNVDECEKNPKEAFLVNSEGTKNMAEACKVNNSFMIHVSTAAVFNGEKDVFYEDDQKDPVNIYGRSKLRAENSIHKILKDSLIIRAAWLIGGGKKEKKFISYIVSQINNGAKEIKVVSDKYGVITYSKELADFIKNAINKNETGVYHIGSEGACSRFDIAKKIVEVMGSTVKIVPVPSSYFNSRFSAPRPNREVIGSKKIKFQKTWRESLEDYLKSEII